MARWFALVRWHLGVALLAGLLGFLAGRWSVRAPPDLQAELDRYRESAQSLERQRDSLREVVTLNLERAAKAESERDRWRARATASRGRADVLGEQADSAERLLLTTVTLMDSVEVLLQACTLRRQECAELRVANAQLDSVIQADSITKLALRGVIGAQAQRIVLDSTRLFQADHLIGGLERAVRGCRVPIVGTPCPTLTASWNLSDAALDVGAGIPVRRWLTVGIQARVYQP